MTDHRANQQKFLSRVVGWAEKFEFTKKDLYRHINALYGKPHNWVESRQRGGVHASKEDIEWMIWAEKNDTTPTTSRPAQYACYDCEEVLLGKPYFTMIPARGDDPGAFLCPQCFKGLEAKGYTPDIIE